MQDGSGRIVGLDPTSRPKGGFRRHAPRPVALDGAVVGLISNGKGQATLLLESLHEELSQLAQLGGKVLVEKEAVFAVPSADEWELVTSRATVGITAFGG
jgi:hypothetical protein